MTPCIKFLIVLFVCIAIIITAYMVLKDIYPIIWICPKIQTCPVDPVDSVPKFPPDTDKFVLHYKNSTNVDIMIWLDDQPFCPRKKKPGDPECKQGEPTYNNGTSPGWALNYGKFYLCKKDKDKWTYDVSKSDRKRILKPGEVWRIVPPSDEDGPYWCFDQGGKRVCPGVGAYITRVTDTPMLAINQVTRFEYNINGDGNKLWFNGSSVDGINTNHNFEYTGDCQGKTSSRSCNIPIGKKSEENPNGCPYETTILGTKTCPSTKWWPKDMLNGECNTGPDLGDDCKDFLPSDLTGCGYPPPLSAKECCHKWWAGNKCAQEWLNYLQKNKSGEKCNEYGWAYDEKRYKPGDTFDHNYNPSDNDVVEPLIVCPIKNGSLNVEITNIL